MNNTSNNRMKRIHAHFSFKFSSFLCFLLILSAYCLTSYAVDSEDNSDNLSAREKFEAGTKPKWGSLDKREWKCIREIPASVREMQKKRHIGTHQEKVDIVVFELNYRVFDNNGYVYMGMGEDFIAIDPRGLFMRSVRLYQDTHGDGETLMIEESADCRDIAEPKCGGIPPVVKVLSLDNLTVTSYLSCLETSQENVL